MQLDVPGLLEIQLWPNGQCESSENVRLYEESGSSKASEMGSFEGVSVHRELLKKGAERSITTEVECFENVLVEEEVTDE